MSNKSLFFSNYVPVTVHFAFAATMSIISPRAFNLGHTCMVIATHKRPAQSVLLMTTYSSTCASKKTYTRVPDSHAYAELPS